MAINDHAPDANLMMVKLRPLFSFSVLWQQALLLLA
jgi:hypothetical protein